MFIVRMLHLRMYVYVYKMMKTDSVIGYSSVWTKVVSSEFAVLLRRFNACPPYFKVASKITRDFAAQRILDISVIRWKHVIS